MKVSTEDLVAVLRMIAKDLKSPDGVANVFIDGAANRMTLLANLAAKHVEEMEAANQRIKRLEEDLMDAKNQYAVLVADVALYEDRGERIKRLEKAGNAMCKEFAAFCPIGAKTRNMWRKAKEAK